MFSEIERNIIIMALMYLKNDYTEDDFNDLNTLRFQPTKEKFEEDIQNLIEDFIGPTWDEETTVENIKRETEKRTRG